MFWSAVLGGFYLLSHWEVWLGIAAYIVVILVTYAAPALLFIGKREGDEPPAGMFGFGCLWMYVARPLICGACLGVILWFLFPVLLGVPSESPSDVTAGIVPAMIVGAISFVAVLLLSIIPLIGGFISDAPGVSTYVQGVVIFSLSFSGALAARHIPDSVLPSFWPIVGFAVIAIAFTYLLAALVALAAVKLSNNSEAIGALVAPVISTLAGILPLLMYASDFASNLRAAGQ